jgi:hypothetical protein
VWAWRWGSSVAAPVYNYPTSLNSQYSDAARSSSSTNQQHHHVPQLHNSPTRKNHRDPGRRKDGRPSTAVVTLRGFLFLLATARLCYSKVFHAQSLRGLPYSRLSQVPRPWCVYFGCQNSFAVGKRLRCHHCEHVSAVRQFCDEQEHSARSVSDEGSMELGDVM